MTSGTMLDRMKLSPVYAFHIAFKIATKKKGILSMELAEEYELRQEPYGSSSGSYSKP